VKKLIAFAALVLCASLGAASAVFSETANVLIYNYENRALVVRQNKTILADLDMPLQRGDTVRTETESYADLVFYKYAGVRLEASSECELVKISESDVHLNLKRGSALVNITKLSNGSSFIVESPLTLTKMRLGIQGQFWVRIRPEDGHITTAVKKGPVDVSIKSSSSAVAVLDLQALEMKAGTFIPNAREVNEEESKVIDKTSGIYILR